MKTQIITIFCASLLLGPAAAEANQDEPGGADQTATTPESKSECKVAKAQEQTEDVRLNAETFQSIHTQISPQASESLWMAIPWLTDLHDARQKAAREGKPLFLMVSGKGLSIGMC